VFQEPSDGLTNLDNGIINAVTPKSSRM
jgi:hypothetical protein